MVELIIETALGDQLTIRGMQYADVFSRAEELGAVLAVDGHKDRYLSFCGKWVLLPQRQAI